MEEYTAWMYWSNFSAHVTVSNHSIYRLYVGWGGSYLSAVTLVRAPCGSPRTEPAPYSPESYACRDLFRETNLDNTRLRRRIYYWICYGATDPLV
jgi:hypothetical protein